MSADSAPEFEGGGLNDTQLRSDTHVLCSAGTDLWTPFFGVTCTSRDSKGCGGDAIAIARVTGPKIAKTQDLHNFQFHTMTTLYICAAQRGINPVAQLTFILFTFRTRQKQESTDR